MWPDPPPASFARGRRWSCPRPRLTGVPTAPQFAGGPWSGRLERMRTSDRQSPVPGDEGVVSDDGIKERRCLVKDGGICVAVANGLPWPRERPLLRGRLPKRRDPLDPYHGIRFRPDRLASYCTAGRRSLVHSSAARSPAWPPDALSRSGGGMSATRPERAPPLPLRVAPRGRCVAAPSPLWRPPGRGVQSASFWGSQRTAGSHEVRRHSESLMLVRASQPCTTASTDIMVLTARSGVLILKELSEGGGSPPLRRARAPLRAGSGGPSRASLSHRLADHRRQGEHHNRAGHLPERRLRLYAG